jgi:serine/threonine protein phosphatase PrpC
VTGLAWASGAAGRPGPGRAVSEDAALVLPALGLWAVADGIGGHAGGAAASRAVIEALAARIAAPAPLAERLAAAEAALAAVHEALGRLGGAGRPPGSTAAVLLLDAGHAACLWVGDSRIYLGRAGRLFALTRDHSVAQELAEAGRSATAAERTQLTRAVGGGGGALAPERLLLRIAEGDRLLLCTDGLTATLAPDRLLAALTAPPEAASAALVAEAAGRGCADDLTALVVAVDAHA